MSSPPPFLAPGGSGFFASFLHAWRGLIHTVVHQRNMRIHVLAAMLVSLVGSGIPLGLAEKVTLIFCVLLIFFAEILNSALEHLVDLAVQQFDEKARVAKDAAAAGVLVLAIGTVVIFAAILVTNWSTVASNGERILRQVQLGLPLVALVWLLLTPRPRPLAVDALALVGALALLVLLARETASIVFSAMALGLLAVAAAAALTRRHEAGAAARRRAAAGPVHPERTQ
ncbi:diacylglycerol kinase family protein [Aggregicoccus sp. 17bor-14]|uniref:diacylglycerol kinase family protein n=1 Tax=Myxococcaceae TaxID=31 RepID=UPI00129C684B|nr:MULTISPECIES: diacylglycerol kinase family protein [Myxococcaceae]MBF5041311.1 diacylglycerol kinase family protein [Simulacricoccus sp. 17bor-14]MRI87097.1 diacylglycerol kinase family protein [Aggregicoccus sp. 17bor-14]